MDLAAWLGDDMYEKKLKAVTPQLFTSNGTALGTLTIAQSCLFKAKQKVLVCAISLPNLELEVKRVEDDGVTLHLGLPRTPITQRTDISAYTTALLATIEAAEQERPSIPEEQVERLTYAEEPIVARRSHLVDCLGRPYTTDNPFPVQLSDGSINIGTVNAELEVQLSAKDNVPNAGDVHDSVRIGDGTEELAINPDGSINVRVSSATTPLVLNTAIPLANTEYVITLPQATTRFLIRMRSSSKYQLSYASGTTNTAFFTVNMGCVYSETDLVLAIPLTLCLRSTKASEVAEIIYWT